MKKRFLGKNNALFHENDRLLLFVFKQNDFICIIFWKQLVYRRQGYHDKIWEKKFSKSLLFSIKLSWFFFSIKLSWFFFLKVKHFEKKINHNSFLKTISKIVLFNISEQINEFSKCFKTQSYRKYNFDKKNSYFCNVLLPSKSKKYL